MLHKLLLSLIAVVGLTLLSSTAKADPIITLTGRAGTGVTASIFNYTLVPAGNGMQKFTFSIRNTSSTGTITNIGFDLPGNRPNTYVLNSATLINPNGDSIHYVLGDDVQANATGLNTTMDFALLTLRNNNGVPNNFNGGYVQSGIDPGQTAIFSITGDFSGLTAQQVASSIFARFQAIGPGGNSDVAGGPGNMSPSAPSAPAPSQQSNQQTISY
jgi:hypothetical protein